MAKEYQYHEEFSKYPNNAFSAKALNEIYYYTGRKCIRGHISPRYASSSNCVQCIAEKRGNVKINKRGKSSKRTKENQELAEIAHAKGFMTYKPTNPCPYGHFERYVTTNNCVLCNEISKEKRRSNARWARIKKIYNLSKDEFYKKLEKQNNVCPICMKKLTLKNSHIDHNHKTGVIRDILCNKCNQAIGMIDEDVTRLIRINTYIEKYNTKELPE